MSEQRQAHRRESIVTEIDEKLSFEAKPLQWQARNDFGNSIVQQHAQSVNEAVKLYVDPDTDVPQLEAKLYERVQDPMALLALAYPEVKADAYRNLTWRQLIELLLAALDVNELQHLKRIIDPNSQPPTENGGTQSSDGAMENLLGQRIESLVGSSSQESAEPLSSGSPSPKSEVS
jgi:hypothetical protein